jgi:hypothetical protein
VLETDSFTITYQAKVDNVLANQNATTLANNLTGDSTSTPQVIVPPVTVTVVEPVLQIAKTITTPTTQRGGRRHRHLPDRRLAHRPLDRDRLRPRPHRHLRDRSCKATPWSPPT